MENKNQYKTFADCLTEEEKVIGKGKASFKLTPEEVTFYKARKIDFGFDNTPEEIEAAFSDVSRIMEKINKARK